MVALSCGYEKLLWKSKSHVCNLKHQSLHQLQYSCFHGQVQWQPYQHFLLNLFPCILKVGPKRPIASEFPLTWSFIRKKVHHKCSWQFQQGMGVLSATKSHFHPRLHKPISKVLPMYRYITVATIYVSGKIFPKQYHALDTVFTDTKNSNILCKCNYDSQRSQVFT